jgi:hypothetical protein
VTGQQLHDLNPSPTHPTGLFWTEALPASSVTANPGAGRATYQATGAAVLDHHDFGNALFGGGPAPVPSTVSFTVRWQGVTRRENVKNAADGHGGEFVFGAAQMAWQGTAGDYVFQSDPLATSSSSFAVLGHERNGVFFHGGA